MGYKDFKVLATVHKPNNKDFEVLIGGIEEPQGLSSPCNLFGPLYKDFKVLVTRFMHG